MTPSDLHAVSDVFNLVATWLSPRERATYRSTCRRLRDELSGDALVRLTELSRVLGSASAVSPPSLLVQARRLCVLASVGVTYSRDPAWDWLALHTQAVELVVVRLELRVGTESVFDFDAPTKLHANCTTTVSTALALWPDHAERGRLVVDWNFCPFANQCRERLCSAITVLPFAGALDPKVRAAWLKVIASAHDFIGAAQWEPRTETIFRELLSRQRPCGIVLRVEDPYWISSSRRPRPGLSTESADRAIATQNKLAEMIAVYRSEAAEKVRLRVSCTVRRLPIIKSLRSAGPDALTIEHLLIRVAHGDETLDDAARALRCALRDAGPGASVKAVGLHFKFLPRERPESVVELLTCLEHLGVRNLVLYTGAGAELASVALEWALSAKRRLALSIYLPWRYTERDTTEDFARLENVFRQPRPQPSSPTDVTLILTYNSNLPAFHRLQQAASMANHFGTARLVIPSADSEMLEVSDDEY